MHSHKYFVQLSALRRGILGGRSHINQHEEVSGMRQQDRRTPHHSPNPAAEHPDFIRSSQLISTQLFPPRALFSISIPFQSHRSCPRNSFLIVPHQKWCMCAKQLTANKSLFDQRLFRNKTPAGEGNPAKEGGLMLGQFGRRAQGDSHSCQTMVSGLSIHRLPRTPPQKVPPKSHVYYIV